MIEWRSGYETELVGEGGLRGVCEAYLAAIGPKGDKLCNMLEPLLPGLHWLANGSGVSDTTMVLVKVFCDMVYIPLLESLNERADEFDLRGIGGWRAGHWGKAIVDGGTWGQTFKFKPRSYI